MYVCVCVTPPPSPPSNMFLTSSKLQWSKSACFPLLCLLLLRIDYSSSVTAQGPVMPLVPTPANCSTGCEYEPGTILHFTLTHANIYISPTNVLTPDMAYIMHSNLTFCGNTQNCVLPHHASCTELTLHNFLAHNMIFSCFLTK